MYKDKVHFFDRHRNMVLTACGREHDSDWSWCAVRHHTDKISDVTCEACKKTRIFREAERRLT